MDLGLFTGSGKIAFYGLGGVALFSGVMLLVQKFMNKKSEEKEISHEAVEQNIEEKIKEISKEQEVIQKQLKQAETASTESKEKIKKIAQKAAVDINKVLKEDSIAKIDEQIDSDWDKL
jgi:galactokinase/mevalonate kinase-like predicted kinase